MPASSHSLDWLPALPFRKGEAKDEALPLAYPRCPLCLEEGAIPYARINHRLAFVTCCPKHKVFLVNKCHACGNHLPFPNEQPFLCTSVVKTKETISKQLRKHSSKRRKAISYTRTRLDELRTLRRAILIRRLPSANLALSNANIEKLRENSAPSRALRRRTAKQCRRKYLLVSW